MFEKIKKNVKLRHHTYKKTDENDQTQPETMVILLGRVWCPSCESSCAVKAKPISHDSYGLTIHLTTKQDI